MELSEAMQRRRSIRAYTKDEISQAQIEKILQAGLLAPSSRNRRSCEFIVVRNRETLNALAAAKTSGSAMLAEAFCAVVVLGDGEKSDAWCEDCSLAMGYMMLAATELGLGSCWVQSRLRTARSGESTEAYVKKLLSVPERYRAEAILALGVPREKSTLRSLAELEMKKIHSERF